MELQRIDQKDVERTLGFLEETYQLQKTQIERRQVEYEQERREVVRNPPFHEYFRLQPPRIEKYLSPQLQKILKPIVRAMPRSVQFALRKLL